MEANASVTGPETRSTRRSPWRLIIRAALSVIVFGMVALAVLTALGGAVTECGDNCPGNYDGDWRYKGQFALAAVAVFFTLRAIVLGFFTAETRAYHQAATVGGALVVLWFLWVANSGL